MDPLAERYYPISPYVYVANNPLKFIDPDGRKIVDPQGSRVTYVRNENGSLTWSKNATGDIIRTGNAMAQTAVGMESLSKLDAIEFNVGMSINTTELRTLSNGAIVSGFAEPTVDNQGKIIQYDITIYEKGIDELTTPKPGSRPAVMKLGEIIMMDNYTKDEHIGAVGVHEATHVTDKKSRGFQNPKASNDEIEKEPRAQELRHYRELDEPKKKQQQ